MPLAVAQLVSIPFLPFTRILLRSTSFASISPGSQSLFIHDYLPVSFAFRLTIRNKPMNTNRCSMFDFRCRGSARALGTGGTGGACRAGGFAQAGSVRRKIFGDDTEVVSSYLERSATTEPCSRHR